MTTPARRVRVAVFGLGAVGLECLRLAAATPSLEVVGAVDDHPERAGRALTALTGLGQLDGLVVSANLEALFRETPPEVILHAGSPRVLEVLPAIRPALELGVSVVSNCAELVFPFLKAASLSREIDALCRHAQSRLVATGINPGFVFDVLPLCLSGCCREVTAVRVERIADARSVAADWREQFGIGAARDDVADRLRLGTAGHVGLPESVAFVAHALGWELDQVLQEGEPVLAPRDIACGDRVIPAGSVSGVRQRARGVRAGQTAIQLDLGIEIVVAAPRDTIHLEGLPPLTVQLAGDLSDASTTPALMINTIPRLLEAAPGLHLATDLALPRWSGNATGVPRNFRV
jgi:2,4-diaminopentanoate dehydrogenase